MTPETFDHLRALKTLSGAYIRTHDRLMGEPGVVAAQDALKTARLGRLTQDYAFQGLRAGEYVLVWPRGYKPVPIGSPAVRTWVGWVPACGVDRLLHDVEVEVL